MHLFGVFAQFPNNGDESAKGQKRKVIEMENRDAMKMVPIKPNVSQEQAGSKEERQLKTAYQLMADYRIYYPAASVNLPILGKQNLFGKTLGFVHKEIVFDPLTDSAIYRNANKQRIGVEVKPGELPSDISSCAATYFKSVEKTCNEVARTEKDSAIKSLAQSLAKEAREHAQMARQAGNDRMMVLQSLLEFRDVHEEHIGRIANEEYWNKLHAEAGGNSLQHGQLYVKRYGETALFFLAMGVSAATGGVAAPWAFGMMGSKAMAQGIANRNPEAVASGLSMLIPFSPNMYAKQLGSLYIGGSIAGSAIGTAAASIRTGTLTPDDRAALITDASIAGGYAQSIPAIKGKARAAGKKNIDVPLVRVLTLSEAARHPREPRGGLPLDFSRNKSKGKNEQGMPMEGAMKALATKITEKTEGDAREGAMKALGNMASSSNFSPEVLKVADRIVERTVGRATYEVMWQFNVLVQSSNFSPDVLKVAGRIVERTEGNKPLGSMWGAMFALSEMMESANYSPDVLKVAGRIVEKTEGMELMGAMVKLKRMVPSSNFYPDVLTAVNRIVEKTEGEELNEALEELGEQVRAPLLMRLKPE